MIPILGRFLNSPNQSMKATTPDRQLYVTPVQLLSLLTKKRLPLRQMTFKRMRLSLPRVFVTKKISGFSALPCAGFSALHQWKSKSEHDHLG